MCRIWCSSTPIRRENEAVESRRPSENGLYTLPRGLLCVSQRREEVDGYYHDPAPLASDPARTATPFGPKQPVPASPSELTGATTTRRPSLVEKGLRLVGCHLPDLTLRETELHQSEDDPAGILRRRLVKLNGPIDRHSRVDGLPELRLADSQLITEDSSEDVGGDPLVGIHRPVCPQDGSVGEDSLPEAVACIASDVLPAVRVAELFDVPPDGVRVGRRHTAEATGTEASMSLSSNVRCSSGGVRMNRSSHGACWAAGVSE